MSKIIIISMLLIILYCLASGLYYFMKDGVGSTRVLKALTWRISLSILIFVGIIAAFWMGWLQVDPTSVLVTPIHK